MPSCSVIKRSSCFVMPPANASSPVTQIHTTAHNFSTGSSQPASGMGGVCSWTHLGTEVQCKRQHVHVAPQLSHVSKLLVGDARFMQLRRQLLNLQHNGWSTGTQHSQHLIQGATLATQWCKDAILLGKCWANCDLQVSTLASAEAAPLA